MKIFARSFLLLAFFSLTLFAAENKDIQVVAVVGKAKVGGRTLRAGDSIKVNEVIETAENSGVKIRLGDRTIIDIAASSVFRVESVRGATKDETVTALDEGGAKASVPSNSAVKASVVKSLNQKPKFYMKTKWSVIAVRGTTFYAVSNESGGGIGVLGGVVDLLDPQGRAVIRPLNAGRMLTGSNNNTNGIGGWTESKAVTPPSFNSTSEVLLDSGSGPTEASLVKAARALASDTLAATGGNAAAVAFGGGTSSIVNNPSGATGLGSLVNIKLSVRRN